MPFSPPLLWWLYFPSLAIPVLFHAFCLCKRRGGFNKWIKFSFALAFTFPFPKNASFFPLFPLCPSHYKSFRLFPTARMTFETCLKVISPPQSSLKTGRSAKLLNDVSYPPGSKATTLDTSTRRGRATLPPSLFSFSLPP